MSHDEHRARLSALERALARVETMARQIERLEKTVAELEAREAMREQDQKWLRGEIVRIGHLAAADDYDDGR